MYTVSLHRKDGSLVQAWFHSRKREAFADAKRRICTAYPHAEIRRNEKEQDVELAYVDRIRGRVVVTDWAE